VNRRVWVLALLIAGCGGGKTEIDITLRAEDAVTDAMLATVRTLHVEAGDPDPYSGDVPLGGHVLQRTEKLVYKPRVDAGAIALTLSAVDDSGALVACTAPAAIQLSPGLGAPLTMTLHPCSGIPDFAVPQDLTGLDLSTLDLQPPDGGVLCPTGAIICDDFEGDLSKWNTTVSDGTTTIDTTQFRHGTHSVHVHVPGPASGAHYQQQFFGLNQFIPYPVYVRAYVYIAGGTVAYGGGIMFVETSVSSTVIFGYGNGVWGLGSQNLVAGEAADQPNSTTNVVGNTWTCIEWLVDPTAPNASGGHERVSINGADVPALHVDGVQLNAANEVLFGWTALINSTDAADIWFDDIAISQTPMGCP
jgi:hypothetical protein